MDHLGISDTTATKAIITGDPDRVPIIAAKFGSERKLTDRRGFVCYSCGNGESTVLVVATGIGGPSTAIAVEELIELGVRYIIRIGTCGALQKHIFPGTIIIPTGCVRDEGTSRQYAPISFPAVPNLCLTSKLVKELNEVSIPFETGLVHCKDAYYLERPWHQLSEDETAAYWRKLCKAGVLATEMESSTLFVLGQLRGIATATILITVGKTHDSLGFDRALNSSICALAEVYKKQLPINRNPMKSDGKNRALSFLDDYEL